MSEEKRTYQERMSWEAFCRESQLEYLRIYQIGQGLKVCIIAIGLLSAIILVEMVLEALP